jgi:DNA-binding transcriptional LysR family regulator
VELLEQADRLSHDLSLNQRPVAKKQVIKVASQRSVAAGWLCRPLAKFARDKTDVEFLVEVGRYELIINAMLEGKADIGFLLSFGPIIDFPSELIGREEFAFFTSPNHPLAGRASVSVSELVAHPFITTKRESRFGQMVHNMLDAAGVRGYQALHQIQEGTIVQELAILGLGVFCGPARLAMGHVHAGALVKIPLQALELYMDVHYIMSPRQRQRQDRLTASFVDFLKQYHG